MTDQVVPPTSGMMPVETPAPTIQGTRAADPDGTLRAASQAANSLPAFGSVTQSASRSGASGVSLDRASTTFDGDNFTITVDRQGGNNLELSTVDDIIYLNDPGPSPLSSHTTLNDGYVLDYKTSETTIAYSAVSWDDTDPTNYLAGGYWLHGTGDLLSSNLAFDEAGAYVDGPEIDTASPPAMPVQGTASYSGSAQGLYATEYGTDTQAVQGSTVIGEYFATIGLTADFAAQTIEGCIGCVGDIEYAGLFTDGATGASYLFNDSSTDTRVRLGTTTVSSNGNFSSTAVAIESDDPDFVITNTSGAWGGRFSNILDASGDPRLVAGTTGGEANTAGGSRSVFVGAYFATK